jgi:hypothetical protein
VTSSHRDERAGGRGEEMRGNESAGVVDVVDVVEEEEKKGGGREREGEEEARRRWP